MNKEIRCTLDKLPEVFDKRNEELELPKYKSDDPLVNGKSMTTNPDRIYRLDRHISEVAKWKRTAQTKQFINYCQWRLGLRDTCDKPSTQILCILSNYKNNRLNLIPENFKVLIDCHKQLVDDAVAVDLRKIKKTIKQDVQQKDKETKSMTRKKSKSLSERIKECERWLRCWTGSTTDGTALPTDSTLCALKRYQIHGSVDWPKAYSSAFLQAMIDNPELVSQIYADVYNHKVCMKTEEQKKMTCYQLYKSIDGRKAAYAPPKQQVVSSDIVTGRHSCTESHESSTPSSTNTVSDTLSMLIQLAKNAGATEITIKL